MTKQAALFASDLTPVIYNTNKMTDKQKKMKRVKSSTKMAEILKHFIKYPNEWFKATDIIDSLGFHYSTTRRSITQLEQEPREYLNKVYQLEKSEWVVEGTEGSNVHQWKLKA